MRLEFWVALALLASVAARAQDVDAGAGIARTWCSNCHLVDPRETKSGSDAVPSFAAIARLKSTTAMSLAAFLSSPHAPMPDFRLGRQEIRDVSAYILSLRDAQ